MSLAYSLLLALISRVFGFVGIPVVGAADLWVYPFGCIWIEHPSGVPASQQQEPAAEPRGWIKQQASRAEIRKRLAPPDLTAAAAR